MFNNLVLVYKVLRYNNRTTLNVLRKHMIPPINNQSIIDKDNTAFCCELVEIDLDTTIAHRPRQLSKRLVHAQDHAEVLVSGDSGDEPVLADAFLVDLQASVVLQERIEAVEDAGTAEVGVVDEQPLTALDGVHQRRVDPFEVHFRLGQALTLLESGQAGSQVLDLTGEELEVFVAFG